MKPGAIIGYDFSTLVDVDGQKLPVLNCLNMALSGLQKSHNVILSGTTGAGKSILGLQLAVSLSICPAPADQIPFLWIPLEMNATEISMRIISMLTGIHNSKVQIGAFTKEEQLKVNKAIDMIAASQFYLRKPKTGSMDEQVSIIEEYKFKYGILGVATDYIQMTTPGPGDRGLAKHEVIGKASKTYKNHVSETLGLVSLLLSQQNRKDYKDGDLGMVQNVGGSYEISTDADDYMILSVKTPDQRYNNATYLGNRSVFMDKRRGGVSDLIIDMDLDEYKDFSLRYSEMMSPEFEIGLKNSMGIK
jgi:replicative DNA helicase